MIIKAIPLKWNKKLVGVETNGDMEQTCTSSWVGMCQGNVAIDLRWPVTGSPAGVFTVQLSNDGTNVAHTYAVTDFSPAMSNPAGSASSTAGRLVDNPFPWIRVVYTVSSGGAGAALTGTISVRG